MQPHAGPAARRPQAASSTRSSSNEVGKPELRHCRMQWVYNYDVATVDGPIIRHNCELPRPAKSSNTSRCIARKDKILDASIAAPRQRHLHYGTGRTASGVDISHPNHRSHR